MTSNPRPPGSLPLHILFHLHVRSHISHLSLSFTFHLKAPVTCCPRDPITSHFSPLPSLFSTLPPISVPCHQFPQGTTITSISMPLSPPIWYIISHLRTSIASHPYTSSPSIFGPHLSPPTLAILYFLLLCSHHLLYLSSHHFPLCASVAFRPGTLTSPCFHPCAFTSSHSVPNCCL